jgi:hypothetical protein
MGIPSEQDYNRLEEDNKELKKRIADLEIDSLIATNRSANSRQQLVNLVRRLDRLAHDASIALDQTRE